MGLFKKRERELDALPADTWSMLEGENNGNVMFIRRRDVEAPLVGHPALPFRLGLIHYCALGTL